MNEPNLKRIGIIGTGDIAAAIVDGLCKASPFELSVVVSPRNDLIARRLAERHSNVRVAIDNQDVLERSEIVILSVRPQVVKAVLQGLEFRSDHRIISVVAACSRTTISSLLNRPLAVCQAAPLLFSADRCSSTVIYPADATACALFSKVGQVIEVDSMEHYDALVAATCTMGTYFGVLETLSDWLASQGIDHQQGSAHLRQVFFNLARHSSASTDKTFAQLRTTYSTRGGLNEQLYADFKREGGIAAIMKAVDAVHSRIKHG